MKYVARASYTVATTSRFSPTISFTSLSNDLLVTGSHFGNVRIIGNGVALPSLPNVKIIGL